MKRNLIVSLMAALSLSTGVCCFAQNAYSDALKLRKYTNEDGDLRSTQDTVYFILDNYIEPNRTNTIHEIDSILRKNTNPFLVMSGAIRSMANGNISSNFFKGVTHGAGGLNVTNIADGIAKFLVERAKQELSISFFRQFKETLNDYKYRHLRTLFANTFSLLQTIDKDIYKFNAYLQSLRDAFIKDLNNLFDTAPQAINDGFLKDAFNNTSTSYLKAVFIYAFKIAKGLKNGKHPGEILENFEFTDPDTATKKALVDINAVLKIIKLFSTSLKTVSGEDKHYWIPKDSINQLLADPITFRIYMGLVYEKASGIFFHDNSTFQEKMELAVDKLETYIDLVKNGIEKFNEVQDAIDELKDKKKSEISYSEYYALFKSVTETLKISDDINNLPGLNIPVPAFFNTFIGLSENTNEFLLDINLKQYSSGVMRLVSIYDTVLQVAFNNRHMISPDSLVPYKNFREKLIKYGTFIATIAEAKNSDEVNSVIEAAVLPVGSSSIKRESFFNISLNAFVGPFAGGEYLPKLKKGQNAFSTGITAPVGVAFSWGKIGKTDNTHRNSKQIGGKSLSIYVPLIDVGSMAAFRLNNDSSEVASEVKLRNIISPGLYFYYGFGKCPVSLGFGAQVGPQLRKINATDINVEKNIYLRYGLSLVVDIPFFNFYTKPDNDKKINLNNH